MWKLQKVINFLTVLQMELKKLRGKEVMAIAVTDPRTVKDADTTELYALENHS